MIALALYNTILIIIITPQFIQPINHKSTQAVEKNAIVKFKGEGRVEPREGSSIDRVGLWNYLTGVRFVGNQIDFSTNCTLVRPIHSLD